MLFTVIIGLITDSLVRLTLYCKVVVGEKK